MMRRILLLVMIGALIAGVLWGKRWLEIDGCLDRGGAWDYSAGKCDESPIPDRGS